MRTYRYYCPERPPAPGAIPRGAIRVECAKDCEDFFDEEGRRINAWGFVEYDHKLTPSEIDDYELEEA